MNTFWIAFLITGTVGAMFLIWFVIHFNEDAVNRRERAKRIRRIRHNHQ